MPLRVNGDGISDRALAPRPHWGSHAGKFDEKPHGVVVARTLPGAPSPPPRAWSNSGRFRCRLGYIRHISHAKAKDETETEGQRRGQKER